MKPILLELKIWGGGQNDGEDAAETVVMPSIYDVAVDNTWSAVEASAARMPSPRYQHAAIIFEDGLFIVGGNCNGRYLADTWRLDLSTLQWKLFENTGLAAIAGRQPAFLKLCIKYVMQILKL